VSAPLTGLEPGTRYYFQLVTTNGPTVARAARSFRTRPHGARKHRKHRAR
jgi:hypothetical protein